MKNDFNYKWSKLFASKRYNTKDGIIQLTPEEQQELLDDAEKVVKKCSIPDVSHQRELLLAFCEFMHSGTYDSHNTTQSQDVDAFLESQ